MFLTPLYFGIGQSAGPVTRDVGLITFPRAKSPRLLIIGSMGLGIRTAHVHHAYEVYIGNGRTRQALMNGMLGSSQSSFIPEGGILLALGRSSSPDFEGGPSYRGTKIGTELNRQFFLLQQRSSSLTRPCSGGTPPSYSFEPVRFIPFHAR